MILVSRNWTEDAALIEYAWRIHFAPLPKLIDIREAFSRIKKNRHDAWIVLYPEGTRRTPNKLLQVCVLVLVYPTDY